MTRHQASLLFLHRTEQKSNNRNKKDKTNPPWFFLKDRAKNKQVRLPPFIKIKNKKIR